MASTSKLCEFFIKNGYCALGDQCKLYHTDKVEAIEEKNELADVQEICFSFDTTGSMAGYLFEVRRKIEEMVRELFSKISSLRVSIIAHGDWCDRSSSYVLKYIDFTSNEQELIQFVRDVGRTRGGGRYACYELVLFTAAHTLSWTPNARSKALVVIGDAFPHEPDFSLNTDNIDWRVESDILKQQGCAVYSIFCGRPIAKPFFQEISRKTFGTFLELSNMKNMVHLFVALCLKTSDDEQLFEDYKNQILRSNDGDDELTKAIMSLSGMQQQHKQSGAHTKLRSAVKRLMYDLKEIQRENLTNIAVAPEEGNVFKWHVNIKPMQGLFQNVYIHLILEFPDNYPSSPPVIKLLPRIPDGVHPNIAHNHVCLPLFGAFDYNHAKSKYGSSWSAAYSIVCLLVNISSIFTEFGESVHAPMQNEIGRLAENARNARCSACEHSHSTPYPVLGCNKLPFKLQEIGINEAYYKAALQEAVDRDDEKQQKEIIKQQRKDRKRGVLIAGTMIETMKNGKFWRVQSQRCINRKYHKTVSWQFGIDMFDRQKTDSSFYSDYIFGFVNEENEFFGVGLDGNVVVGNNAKYNQVYTLRNDSNLLQHHPTMTYVLHLNNTDVKESRDQLYILVNYNLIASVPLPALYTKSECFYPVMYVKDIRLQLTLDFDPKLQEKLETLPFRSVEAFNKLQADYITKETIESAGIYYHDQLSWNKLLERALSNDVMLTMFAYLSYCDLIHCKHVNTFWHSVLTGHNVIDRKEVRCFFTKQSIYDHNIADKEEDTVVLGVGLNVTRSNNNWIRSISTDMDLLSMSAYTDYNVNKGAWGETITHFLPLVINEKHAVQSSKHFLQRLALICDDHANADSFQIENGFRAIKIIMNQFVAQLMSAVTAQTQKPEDETTNHHMNAPVNPQQLIDPKFASEKALVGYVAFHHMLLWLTHQFPQIREIARAEITTFIENETCRTKKYTPDLGVFLMNLAVAEEYDWADLADAFVHESLDRKVKWYLNTYPDLEYLDDRKCSDEYRIHHTLLTSKVSRKLIQFQVWFITNICRNKQLSASQMLANYDKTWGRPTPQQKRLLCQKVKQILNESDDAGSWLKYFHTMGIHKYSTNSHVCEALKAAVRNSASKGYHCGNELKMNYKPCRNLKVKYLPATLNEQQLAMMFASFGQLMRWKIVRDRATGESRGYGFVEYMHAWDAEVALSQTNGLRVLGKTLKVSFADNTRSARPPSDSETKTDEESTLFVSDIPPAFKDWDLHSLFAKYGKIVSYTILRTRDGESRGIGFVQFSTYYEALKAIRGINEMNRNRYRFNSYSMRNPYGATPLQVKFAKKRPGSARFSRYSGPSTSSVSGASSSNSATTVSVQNNTAAGYGNAAVYGSGYGYVPAFNCNPIMFAAPNQPSFVHGSRAQHTLLNMNKKQ